MVNCCENKISTPAKAIDLYDNTTFNMIRKHLSTSNARINVLVLSAEHGIISGNDNLEPYDTYIEDVDTNKLVIRTRKSS
ncbi:DUF6884 domain-containing protein [Photobacterium lutimaris]|uniref:DUF6884 domain-containing protein n=1 Tax=Photobacterium lutimaris TaxID=388278 RepID=UPI003B84B2BC